MGSTASELFDASLDHVRRGRVRDALRTLLDALTADPHHTGALESAGRICHLLGHEEDARLFQALVQRPRDAEGLYALGYRLVEQDRPEVGAVLLGACLESHPEEVPVRRELAYARLQSRDFEGCLQALAPLADSANLADSELLDVLLVRAEALIYARDRDACQRALEQAEVLVPDDAQRERLDGLHALVGRSQHWSSLDGLGLREWHFIQHAGVILKTAGGYFEDDRRQGRFDVLTLRPDMLAFLLQRLAHLLQCLLLVPEVVIPASPLAAPLAHALARRLDAAVADRPEQRAGRGALLVAAAAGELAPLASGLAQHRPDLRLFALNLDFERDAPVCPDVAGVLARRVLLPWEPQFALNETTGNPRDVPADNRPPAALGAELVQLMDALPDDGGEARDAFEGFYRPLASDLVLGHEDRHPYRRRFTRLSPCGTAAEEP